MRAISHAGLSIWLIAIASPSAAFSEAAGHAFQQPTRAAANLTKSEVERAFAQAMFACLATRLGKQTVKDAPEELRSAYSPASDNDRWWADPAQKLPANTPIWMSQRLGSLLFIVEPSPERCEVRATQLPVQATFQTVVAVIQQQYSDVLTPIALKPGYDPIAYQFEHVENGTRYVVHMEGAEPGAPGHALRYSLLLGVVLRQPAADSPAFR